MPISLKDTANITTANWGTARNIQIGNTAKSVNGSANVSWSLSEIGALSLSGGTLTGLLSTPNNQMGIRLGDDVLIGDGNIANNMVLQGSQDSTLGGITFGSGKDTNIYRGGANLLKTDDTMNAVGGFQWNGQSLDNRYAAASHSHAYAPTATGSSISIHADSDSSSTSEYLLLKAGHNELKIASSAGGTTVTKGQDKLTFNGNIVYHAGRKPTISEIGAAASSHTHNNITSRGKVTCETGVSGRPAVAGLSMSEAYNNGYPDTYGNVINLRGQGDGQIFVGWSGNDGAHAPVYVRSKRDNTNTANWSGWAQFYTTANPQTTITGNAGTATKLQTARTINGTNFDGTGNITTANWGTARTITIGKTGKSVNGSGNVSWATSEILHQGTITTQDWNTANVEGIYEISNFSGSNSPTGAYKWGGLLTLRSGNVTNQVYLSHGNNEMWIRGGWNGSWNDSWSRVYTTSYKPSLSDIGAAASSHTHNYAGSSSAGGAANSATKLATARSINGTNFDGTGNITTANWGTARNIQIGNTAKSVNGSANVTWTLGDIGAAASNHTHGLVNLNSEAFGGGNDLNTYNPTKTWVARTLNSTTNKPADYFTVVNFGANANSNFQLAHSYANSSTLYVRGRHDTSGNYTPWAKIYTDKNKPTASDIGAAPSSSTSLKTTDKTIVGAINEVFQSGNSVKQNLVDTLIAKGAENISTSNSWDSLIDIIEGSNISLAPASFTVEPIPNAQYGFRLLGSGPYYESENRSINSSYAMCKLNIVCNSNYDVYLDCISYGEDNYDYGIISEINTPLSLSYQADTTGVLKSFKGLSSPGVQSVRLSPESGFYYIKYIKDSSQSSGNDSLRFAVRFQKKTGGNPGVPDNPGGEGTILFSPTIGGDNRSLTGGYTHLRQDSDSYLIYDASCIDFCAQSNTRGNTLETVLSENRIELTNYSRLRIKAYVTTSTNDSGGAPLVGFDALGNHDEAFAASTIITSSAQRYYDLDISSLTGHYHLKFNVATSMTNPGTIIKHLYITELILYP